MSMYCSLHSGGSAQFLWLVFINSVSLCSTLVSSFTESSSSFPEVLPRRLSTAPRTSAFHLLAELPGSSDCVTMTSCMCMFVCIQRPKLTTSPVESVCQEPPWKAHFGRAFCQYFCIIPIGLPPIARLLSPSNNRRLW